MTSPCTQKEVEELRARIEALEIQMAQVKAERGPKHPNPFLVRKHTQSIRTYQILCALADGQNPADVARQFGVTRQWVSYVRSRQLQRESQRT